MPLVALVILAFCALAAVIDPGFLSMPTLTDLLRSGIILGIFAVGKLPINPSFDLFARVGASRIETSPGGDLDGLAYGAGAQWNLTSVDGIRGDWTRHDYDEGDVDAYSLSYVRTF